MHDTSFGGNAALFQTCAHIVSSGESQSPYRAAEREET